MNEKLNPKAIIFDLGSTLIEYEKVPWVEMAVTSMKEVAKFLRKQKKDIPDDEQFIKDFESVKSEYRKLASDKFVEWTIPQAAEKLLKKLSVEADEKLIDGLFNAYYKPVEKNLSIYDDTIETLELVKSNGYTIGLVSNTIFPEATHLKELKKFKIDKYFDFTLFSSTFGLRKPHEDVFVKASNLAGYAPSECVYIGDRYLEDVTGPESIGMHAILKKLDKREYPTDMPETIRSISCLAELPEHIDFTVEAEVL